MFWRSYSWEKSCPPFAYSSRHRLLVLLEWAETEVGSLQKNDTFNVQKTIDRQIPWLKFNYCLHFNPPFLFLATFKYFRCFVRLFLTILMLGSLREKLLQFLNFTKTILLVFDVLPSFWTQCCGSVSADSYLWPTGPAPEPASAPDTTPFFSDFKNAKKIFFIYCF